MENHSKRVFKIVIDGVRQPDENAGSRTAEEVQHALITAGQNKSVRVIERYIRTKRSEKVGFS